MRFLPLRSRLAAVVALAALPACGSVFPDDCPHTVVDKSVNVALDAAAACAVAQSPSRSFQWSGADLPTCRQYCNDDTITNCMLSQEYMTAYDAANPNGVSADGGAAVCPAIAQGMTAVSLTCQVAHTEGTATKGCPINGRRPAGLEVASADVAMSALGAYFAGCAQLEAASVIAFRVMRAELVAHGAPEALVRAAVRAEREEVRHTELARALTERFGGAFVEPRVGETRVRSLAEIAMENVVEGVVRETYGAAVALWQMDRADDEDVRAALREIAEDECGHAELSWSVAEWVRARLGDEERAAVDAAMRAAIDELAREVTAEPARGLREVAGVPSASEASRILAELEAKVWGGREIAS
jgi:hypothetical protein